MEFPKSTLVKKQVKAFRKELANGDVIIAQVRFDDNCGNGHNTFSVTGELYDRGYIKGESFVVNSKGKNRYLGACGCIHELIGKHFPELAPVLKWHLVSSDGPLHYVANATYHANDKDCWGLRKGEKRQIVNGRTKLPCWHLVAIDAEGNEVELFKLDKYVDSKSQPACVHRLEYRPLVRVGEGKEPNLEAARSVAVWPDATAEQLQDEAALLARLPALMEEFKRDVESLGFVY